MLWGPVVWIPGIPENERDFYLGVPLESSQTTGPPNHQLTISGRNATTKNKYKKTRRSSISPTTFSTSLPFLPTVANISPQHIGWVKPAFSFIHNLYLAILLVTIWWWKKSPFKGWKGGQPNDRDLNHLVHCVYPDAVTMQVWWIYSKNNC